MRADVEFAAEVLSKAVERSTNPQARFDHAIELRHEMRTMIQSGSAPTGHYRYQWLLEMTRKMLGVLCEWGIEFDKKHPQDVSTVLDFLDIVETVRHSLLRQIDKLGMTVEATSQIEKPKPAPGEEPKGEA